MISIWSRTRTRSMRWVSVLTISGLLGALSSTGWTQNPPLASTELPGAATGPVTANRPAVVQHTRAMFGAQPPVIKSKRPARLNDLLTEFQKQLALPPQNIPFASFAGNTTVILATPGNGFVMGREPNCSLTAYNEPYTLTVTDPYGAATSETPNYEQLLHSEAGLTTTADGFGGKCPDPVLGVNANDTLFVGTSTGGMGMAAFTGFNAQANSNLLFTLVTQANGAFVSATQQTLPGTNAPATVVAGDLNGDGNPDLIAVGGSDTGALASAITVLLGNADGTFTVGQTYALGANATDSAVIGDFNGDGKLDVVAAVGGANVTPGAGSLTFLPGNGDGTFGTPVSLPLTTAVENLVAGDFNGDGKLDVASGSGSIFLGNGNGSFQQTSTPFFSDAQIGLVGGSRLELAAGDFNKDGKLDLAGSNGNQISIFPGNGDGTFKIGNTYAGIGNGGYLTATDLDGDGNLDLYSGDAHAGVFGGDRTTPNEGYALMGRGDGTFVGAPQVVDVSFYTLQNLNADQNLDFVGLSGQTANGGTPTLTTYYGNGDGTFAAAGTPLTLTSFTYNSVQYTVAGVESYVVADLNGDGKPDLFMIAYGTNTPSIGLSESVQGFLTALGTGNGSFASPTFTPVPDLAPAGTQPAQASVSNMLGATNQNGQFEIVYNYTAGYNSTTQSGTNLGVATQVSNGDGTFAAPAVTVLSTTGNLATVASVADLNGDKIPDLIIFTNPTGTAPGVIQVMLGNSNGTFAAPVTVAPITIATGAYVYPDYPFAVADVNGDGFPDIVALGSATSTGNGYAYGVALNKGDGTFNVLPPVLLANSLNGWGLPAIGDFNDDGKADLALAGGIFLGNGDGTFQSIAPASGSTGVLPSQALELLPQSTSVAPAGAFDLNGSGKMDLLAGSTFFVQTAPAVTPPALVSTTTNLKASASSITAGTSATFTATVAPASGTAVPTGTVTFMNGTATLGTGTLNGTGVATFATSSLAVGAQSITAVYGGDSNFSGSTSSAVTVTVTAAPPPSFSIGASPASGSVSAGGSAQTTITVTPAGGFKQQLTFACSGLPSGGTCTFAPTTVTPNGTAATTTALTIATASTSASVRPARRGSSSARGASALALLAGGLLWTFGLRRRTALWKSLQVGVALLLSAAALVLGCGGGGSGSGGGGSTPPQTYTVTISATDGSATQTATFALTVQ
jgi:hypothetical protein